jgi:hypothetical protein
MSEAKPYAMIDAEGKVYNITLWDGETPWTHDAVELVQSDTARIGDDYVNGEFKTPVDPAMANLLRHQREALK